MRGRGEDRRGGEAGCLASVQVASAMGAGRSVSTVGIQNVSVISVNIAIATVNVNCFAHTGHGSSLLHKGARGGSHMAVGDMTREERESRGRGERNIFFARSPCRRWRKSAKSMGFARVSFLRGVIDATTHLVPIPLILRLFD